jgi:hypothetical protein
MDQRKIRIVGVVFLLWGCLSGLYLAVRIANARIEGIFSTVASGSPSNRFEHLRCPLCHNRQPDQRGSRLLGSHRSIWF